MGNDGRFKIGFGVGRLFMKTEKFEEVGAAKDVFRLEVGRSHFFLDDGGFIGAEARALVLHAVDGALEVADAPVVFDGLEFVEGPLQRVVEVE